MILTFVDRDGMVGTIRPDGSVEYDGTLGLPEESIGIEAAVRDADGDEDMVAKALADLMVDLHTDFDIREAWIERDEKWSVEMSDTTRDPDGELPP